MTQVFNPAKKRQREVKEANKGVLKRRIPLQFYEVSAETVPWDEDVVKSIKNRLESYRKAKEILATILGGQDSCPRLGATREEPMYLAGRLGNKQTSSNVFRIGFRDYRGSVVLKILPHTNYYSFYNSYPPDPNGEKSKQEAQIANRASDAVKAGKTTYFPLVYGQGACDKVILPAPSSTARRPARERYNEALYWASSRAMIEMYVPLYARKDFVERATGKKPEEVLEEIRATYVPGATLPTDPPIRAELILMETAWGDLSKYLWQAETDKEEVRRLILRCLFAIFDLQTKLKIKHQDLVPENILIQKIEDEDGTVRPHPLIADFGNAVEFTGLGGREEKLHDVKKFFEALLDKPTGLTKRIDYMVSLIKYPDLYVDQYGIHRIDTMKDVIEYWRMKPTVFMNVFKIDRKHLYTMNKLEGNSGNLGKEGLGEFGEFGEKGKEGDDRLARFLL
jgi:hypothetical protein